MYVCNICTIILYHCHVVYSVHIYTEVRGSLQCIRREPKLKRICALQTSDDCDIFSLVLLHLLYMSVRFGDIH